MIGTLPATFDHFDTYTSLLPLDGTWTGAAAGAASDVGTRVVSDALVMADGEAANHSGNVTDLRTHFGVSFARRGAPYHPHYNGPVETMVKLLKAVVVDMGRVAGLSIAAHWPLLIAHAATSSTACLECLCKGVVLARRWTGLPPTSATIAPLAARP
jgi:hypothetical protein